MASGMLGNPTYFLYFIVLFPRTFLGNITFTWSEMSDIETTIEIEVSINKAIFFAGPKIFAMNDSEMSIII